MRIAGIGAGLAALLLLSACGDKAPAPPADDTVISNDAPPPNLPLPGEPAPPPEEPKNEVKAVSNLAEEVKPSEDEQMREDADAVGMTSRMPVEESSGGDAVTNAGE